MSSHPKVFYGWWIVTASSLGLFLSTGPVVVFSFGIFLKSLIQDFHAGRGAVSFAFTLHNLMGPLCVPLVGRLIDRFGARRVILIGTAISECELNRRGDRLEARYCLFNEQIMAQAMIGRYR